MTGPAIAQPSAAPIATPTEQSPATPVVEQVTEEAPRRESTQSVIDRLARKVTPESQGLTPRDDDPNAAPADALLGGPTDIVPPPTVTPVAESHVMEVTLDDQDGTIEIRARADDGKFEPIDKSKKYELRIKDKETGETRVYNKDMPEVLRLAKDGIAMQKSRDELTYYRQNVGKWEKSTMELRNELEGHKALALALLTEPEENVVQRRDAYKAQFTPEAENARLKQRIEALTQTPQSPTVAQPVQPDQHLQQNLATLQSRIGQTVSDVEGLVGKERAAGKIAIDTAPLMVNGRIPVERFQQLENYINGPYKAWAQAEAANQRQTQTAADTALAEARRTQQAAQRAAQTVGTATRPSPVNPNATVAPKPIRSKDDAINRIISRPIAAGA